MNLFDKLKPADDFSNALDRFSSVIDSIPVDNVIIDKDADADAISGILKAVEDKGELPESELSKLFTDLEQPKDRLSRFAMYEAIYNNVQLAKRAITVYLNNTFLRNALTNKHYAFHIIPNMDESKVKQAKQFAESFFKTQDFFKTLKDTTKDCLIYGDGYIEFIDLQNVNVNYPVEDKTNHIKPINEDAPFKRLLAQVKKKNIDISPSDLEKFVDSIVEVTEGHDLSFDECLLADGDGLDSNVILESSELFTEKDNEKSNGKEESNLEDASIFRRFIIRRHKPASIVELHTDYGLTLGYVRISVEDQSILTTTNVVRQFMNVVNLTGGGINSGNKKKGVNIKIKDITQTLVSKIIKDLGIVKDKSIRNPKKSEEQYRKDIEAKLQPELLWAVKRLLVAAGESDITSSKIKVRYIKPSSIYNLDYPGGISVIDTMAYPAKLYLLIQLTNLLSRLSKSAVIRKWTLDIGSRENASTVVRRLKEELRNQRITASSMITSDVSKIITDFKDLITVTKNGKSYVDVNVENLGDPSTSTQDLEFQRNEVIAVSGIPASYLGYNDSFELRDQLVHANISFANEIMGVQSEVNNVIMAILDKAAISADLEPVSKYISVALTPPMVLMLQVMETVMSSFSVIYSTVAETLKVPVDPISLLEQFVPYTDWKSVIEQGKKYKQEQKVSPPPADQGGF